MTIEQPAAPATNAFEALGRSMPVTAGLKSTPARNESADAYYPWFDWLRFALANVVMLVHFGLIRGWSDAGNFAVQVFFSLSGWLIGGLLLEQSRRDLPRFYFNRAVRIWAPYYLGLGFLIAASLLREPATAKWLEIVTYKATFVYNLFGTRQLAEHVKEMPLAGTGSHFWSVNAEEQFYLLAPLLLVLAAPRFGRHVLTWTVIAVAAYVLNIYSSIVFGVLAATLHRRLGNFHHRTPVRLLLVAVLLAASPWLFDAERYPYAVPWVSIAIVLLLAVEGKRQRIGSFAGGLSYPLYLNHWIGGFTATVLLIPFGLRQSAFHEVLSVGLAIGLAGALYWWMERPLLARRRKMYSPSRGVVVTAVAYAMVIAGVAIGFARLT